MTATYVAGQMQIRMFTQVGHNQVMNAVHLDTMETIKHRFMPFHFMMVAYQRYAAVYVKRSKRYQIMKARVVHHQRPNEFTGALRLSVLLDSKTRSTATRGTFEAKAPLDTTILTGPRAGQTIRRPLTEQRRKEIEYVSDEEIELLKARQIAMYRAAVYDPKYQKTVLKQFR
jgi:hypothetical protein